MGFVQVIKNERYVSEHSHHQVIKIMCHPPGQGSDGLHALGFLYLKLKLFIFRYISDNDEKPCGFSFVIIKTGNTDAHFNKLIIFRIPFGFKAMIWRSVFNHLSENRIRPVFFTFRDIR